MVGRLPMVHMVEVNSGSSSKQWIDRKGKARFRWDAIRKVTGHKNFTRADLSMLGSELQPDKLLLQEDLTKDGLNIPQELKKRMITGGYDFIKRTSVHIPSKNRSNTGPTTYTPASCRVELNVNAFTGAVVVMRHHMLIVPELVFGQVQGGTAMGIGHALMEELPLYTDDPGNGSWNFNRYTLPRAKNVAVWNQVVDYMLPLPETSPPKGMAEISMFPIVPATGNAIAHATGKRFYEFPITAKKIKKALS